MRRALKTAPALNLSQWASRLMSQKRVTRQDTAKNSTRARGGDWLRYLSAATCKDKENAGDTFDGQRQIDRMRRSPLHTYLW